MNDARAAWSRLMGSDLMQPLSPVARVSFVLTAVALAFTAVAIFIIDLITYASSTGALIFLAVPVFAGVAYGVIFAVDFALRLGVRALRSQAG